MMTFVPNFHNTESSTVIHISAYSVGRTQALFYLDDVCSSTQKQFPVQVEVYLLFFINYR
jgi:hypothetical protein